MLLIFWRSGPAAATPSIRLSLQPSTYPFGQAAPSIKLSLGPILARQPAQVAPSIRLTLAPSGLDRAFATVTPSIRLVLLGYVAGQITTIYTVSSTTNQQGLVEDILDYHVGPRS